MKTETNSAERVHHPYSPSSLQAREGCAKFEPIHDGPVHEMATIGTRQHDAVDSQVDDPRLLDYRAAAVVDCIRFAEERLAAFPGGTMLKESYLPVDNQQVTGPDKKKFLGTTAGYLDVAIISADETEAEVIDWKFGNNAVEEARNNLQGIAYALGLRHKFPKLKRITVRFIMPHIDHATEHTFLASDFDTMLLRVRTVVLRAIQARKDPEDYSMATPNASSCLFCALIGKCPKVAEIALKVGKKYRPLEIPENVTPTLVRDSKDVGIGIKLAQVLSTWAEAFRRQATARTVEDPNFIPDGYVLVESQRRSVVKAKSLGDIAKRFIPADKHGMVDDLFDVPIGKLEELVALFAARGVKEKTQEDFGKAAMDEGALQLGKPFSFLRQHKVADGEKKVTNKE